jgi:hypothetical protein
MGLGTPVWFAIRDHQSVGERTVPSGEELECANAVEFEYVELSRDPKQYRLVDAIGDDRVAYGAHDLVPIHGWLG